jgi:hypothetical protein
MMRALWRAAVALVALLTCQLQVDRQSARQPGLARFVAEPFRAEAQVHLATQALDRQATRTALDETRKLLARRPLPAAHLTLMARAHYANGDLEAASRVVQLAALRGWRDPIAQEIRLQLALAAGDEPEAARRFIALMVGPTSDNIMLASFGQQVFGGSDGQAVTAVVDLASNTRRWHGILLRRGSEVIPEEAFAQIIGDTLARGTSFRCAELAVALDILGKKDPPAAKTLQAAVQKACPAQGQVRGHLSVRITPEKSVPAWSLAKAS